jgi:uncharacterized protein YeaO (DUF488 family)
MPPDSSSYARYKGARARHNPEPGYHRCDSGLPDFLRIRRLASGLAYVCPPGRGYHGSRPFIERRKVELYTSHWRNLGLADLDAVKVGISRGVPRGRQARELPYRYKRLMDLAPRSELFERWKAGTISPEEYTREYRGYLDELGPEEVMVRLQEKSVEAGGKPLVLLCWCREFCHRRVWADWYLEKTGQEVPELPVGKLA